MTFLGLMREYSKTGLIPFMVIAAVAGMSNALILAFVNAAAQQATKQEVRPLFGLLIAASILIYVWSQRRMMLVGSRQVETMVEGLRVALIDLIRHAELRSLEQLGLGDVHRAIANDTEMLSRTANAILMGMQSAVLVAFTLVYLALIAPIAFIASLAMIIIGSKVHLGRMPTVHAKFAVSLRADAQLFDDIDDVLSGFKEIKMSSLRREQLTAVITAASVQASHRRIEVHQSLAVEYVLGQVLFFVLLGAAVFILPGLSFSHGRTTEAMTALLFLSGSLGVLLQAIPMWAQADATAQRLSALHNRLRASTDMLRARSLVPENAFADFHRLRLADAVFAYDASGEAFTVGSLDLTIKRNEVLFLVGGNGSGKSTILKLLAGLYTPHSGRLEVDGKIVDDRARHAYRRLVAAVFSDFHLFQQPYGLENRTGRIPSLMRLLALEGVVEFDGKRFDSLDLSTGQRKRLALITALLEDRPILILDEWAADQDPASRRRFYEELLPLLREQGKTIIVATHDEQYFHTADRIVHVENGRLIG